GQRDRGRRHHAVDRSSFTARFHAVRGRPGQSSSIRDHGPIATGQGGAAISQPVQRAECLNPPIAEPAGSESPPPSAENPTSQPSNRRRRTRGAPGLSVGLRLSRVFRGLEGVWKQREVHLRPRETHPVTRGQATSSITGGAVSTCAVFPNALPLRSWITWQARSSSSKCADEGNARLRASTSAEAGLRPSVQAARTRKAVSISSLGFIDPVSWLFQYFSPECMFLYMGRQS